MKELTVISGKGGTGKTSIVASLAVLAENKVLVDCDVDAPDLHLIMEPKTVERQIFVGGREVRILPGHCTACGKCEEICQFDAVFFDGPGNGIIPKTFRIDQIACEGCGVCAHFCAEHAIESKDAHSGEWYVSETRYGPMVHARLFPARENTGKLVSTVRKRANQLAKELSLGLILVDGPPGIGCPVISSLSGTDHILIVTEPTLSALHDLRRVHQLATHFGVKCSVCLNKCDLNLEVADEIEAMARREGMPVLARIAYDNVVTEAQVEGKAVVEFSDGAVSKEIKSLWSKLAPIVLG